MAPEIFCQKEYDPRAADIYSLGVLLLAMRIGALPIKKAVITDLRFKLIATG